MHTVCHLLVALFLLPHTLYAQSFLLEGQIVDAITGKPLSDANLNTGTTGLRSDDDGHFSLSLTPSDSLTVSFVGYKTRTLHPQNARNLTIRLHRTILATPELVVHGGLKSQALDKVATSVTILDRSQLQAAGGHHLQDLSQAVPNLNWAGGTSRPRYFQIRGMGERSQYAGEGPPNFSVGFVIDDVDISGLGTAGLLFDMDQLEIFKGPQSTTFGPNAMAGLIKLQSTDPTPVASRSVDLALGSDALAHFSGTLNQPLSDKLSLRLGYTQARADGFRDNQFLNKSNSNQRDENFARAKLRYADEHGLSLLFTAFRSDQDNGYDTWTPDNNEDLVTYTDKPGKDHQVTTALSLKAEKTFAATQLVSISSFSNTELEYSFDGDWGNEQYWLQPPYNFNPEVEGWHYDFFDRTLRTRDNFTQELRLLRGNAIAGVYFKTLEESDDAQGYLFGGEAADLQSVFQIDNLAFYGQYDQRLNERTELSLNLRVDRNAIDYRGTTDSADWTGFDINQWLTGGKLALTHNLGRRRHLYAAASRGYRAGGVNQHPRLAAENRPYDPEYLLNFEIGYRASSAKSTTNLTFFHALRDEQQVSLSSQQNPGDPNSFFFFTANASTGRSSGIEFEQSYSLLPTLRLSGSLGLLRTHVDAYSFEAAEGTPATLGDRDAAHAPAYTARLGTEYTAKSGLFARLDMTATDAFFHSDSHDQKSDAYQLFHGRLGYKRGAHTFTLWGRNLLDERYTTRGFFFGLAPPNYADTLYKSYGDPRQLGLSLSTAF